MSSGARKQSRVAVASSPSRGAAITFRLRAPNPRLFPIPPDTFLPFPFPSARVSIPPYAYLYIRPKGTYTRTYVYVSIHMYF